MTAALRRITAPFAAAAPAGTRVRTRLRVCAEDEAVLNTFATQVAAAAEQERLVREASRAAELAAANTLRASLLQAVSHDLRTPLASIKASISSLRQRDVTWSRLWMLVVLDEWVAAHELID